MAINRTRSPFRGTGRKLADGAAHAPTPVPAQDQELPPAERDPEGMSLFHSLSEAPAQMLETIFNTWKEKTYLYAMIPAQSFNSKWAKIIVGAPAALVVAVISSIIGIVAVTASVSLSVAATCLYFFASIKPFTAPFETLRAIIDKWKEQTPINAMLAFQSFNSSNAKYVFGTLLAIVTVITCTAIGILALAASALMSVAALPFTISMGWLTWNTNPDDPNANDEASQSDLRKIIAFMAVFNGVLSYIASCLPATSAIMTFFSSTAAAISQYSVGSIILSAWSSITSLMSMAGHTYLALTPLAAVAWAPPIAMFLGTLSIGYASYAFLTKLAIPASEFISKSLKDYFTKKTAANEPAEAADEAKSPSVRPAPVQKNVNANTPVATPAPLPRATEVKASAVAATTLPAPTVTKVKPTVAAAPVSLPAVDKHNLPDAAPVAANATKSSQSLAVPPAVILEPASKESKRNASPTAGIDAKPRQSVAAAPSPATTSASPPKRKRPNVPTTNQLIFRGQTLDITSKQSASATASTAASPTAGHETLLPDAAALPSATSSVSPPPYPGSSTVSISKVLGGTLERKSTPATSPAKGATEEKPDATTTEPVIKPTGNKNKNKNKNKKKHRR